MKKLMVVQNRIINIDNILKIELAKPGEGNHIIFFKNGKSFPAETPFAPPSDFVRIGNTLLNPDAITYILVTTNSIMIKTLDGASVDAANESVSPEAIQRWNDAKKFLVSLPGRIGEEDGY